MTHMENNNLPIESFDPSFSNLERFEASQGWHEFDCTTCNDTGYDYDLQGCKVLCTCEAGLTLAEQLSDPDEVAESWDMSDDGEALASAGWGTDEDYGYDYDDWN